MADLLEQIAWRYHFSFQTIDAKCDPLVATSGMDLLNRIRCHDGGDLRNNWSVANDSQRLLCRSRRMLTLCRRQYYTDPFDGGTVHFDTTEVMGSLGQTILDHAITDVTGSKPSAPPTPSPWVYECC